MGAVMFRLGVVALLLLSPPLAGTSWAQEARSADASAGAYLAEGRRLYRELDFEGCIRSMRRVLSVPGVAPARRIEALEYLGAAYVVLEREAEAEEAFGAMLDLDPYYRVREPSGSPKIERFVAALRSSRVPDAALDEDTELSPELPAAARVGRAIPVRFEVVGPGAVDSVRVRYRSDEVTGWSSVTLEEGNERDFEGVVPAAEASGRLWLYAVGRDAQGRVVVRGGEPLAPLLIEVRPVPASGAGPSSRRWWIGAIVAVAIAGAALGLGFGLSGGQDVPAGSLPPGRARLP